MVDSFPARFAETRARSGPLVWGLDPSGAVLDGWGLGDTPDGLDRFADLAVEAAAGTVGLVKPQSAYYERHGWRGIRTLERLVSEARSAGLLVVLDAKRGDIGPTNDAYAQAYLAPGAPSEVDALTVHPYLGLGAMGALVEAAHEHGRGLFVVTRSSNPEGRLLQTAETEVGTTVEATLLDEIAAANRRLAPGGIGPIGAVVGPLHDGDDLDLDLAGALFLAPGLGAQGAAPADLARAFARCLDRVLPSASRSLLAHGPDLARLRDGVTALATQVQEALAAPS